MTRKFNSIRKDRLFYDRFEYCLGFYLEEANCLRMKNHEEINDMLQRRQQWREMARQRWANGSKYHGLALQRHHKSITEKTITDLHTIADVFLTTPIEHKLVVTVDQGYVYTNDLSLIDHLDTLPELTQKSYSQARVTRPKNTIHLKNPQHAFRSYFKSMKLTYQQKDHLENFLHSQRGDVRISPALSRWVDHPFNNTQDYFFVDHATQSWLTMLSLVCPNLIRKTMQIQQAK